MEKNEVLKELLTKVYNLNPTGSLSNFRKIIGKANDCESDFLKDLAGYAHLVSFNLFKEAQDYAARFFLESHNFAMLTEVKKLIAFYNQPHIFIPKDRQYINPDFRHFCQQHGLTILKTLQQGIDNIRYCSWVYLVRDTDGIIKVYKEVLSPKSGPLVGVYDTEDILYSGLPVNNFLPQFFGPVDVYGTKFIKQSVHFGKTLSLSSSISKTDVQAIILKISQSIQFLHSHNIAYLDIKPENFLINSSSVLMLDLGISRVYSPQNDLDIYLSDPRFATPEGTTQLKATPASDIFQLGILYYWLLIGHHPFDLVPLQADNMDTDRESALLRYALPTSVLNFSDLSHSQLPQLVLIEKMLARDPSQRPSIDDVVTTFDQKNNFFIQKPEIQSRHRQNNTILFPARMGIPHRGHIEYISRLLHLGYFVLISIQRSYTLTDRDPIQKSFVMKMVAQSLIDQGFTPDVDFSFIATPYYSTKAEMECHFLSLPQIDDVIGVASSNPGIPDLFPDWPIFDQNSVFGSEGQEWQVRSWGEIIRQSVRDNNYAIFSQYAASGVEQILPFSELRSVYKPIQIEFAKTVEVVCLQNNLEISRGRVFRYQFPEQSLVSHLRSLCGYTVKVDNLYSRDSLIEVNGRSACLSYLKTDFDVQHQHETIYYNLLLKNPSVD